MDPVSKLKIKFNTIQQLLLVRGGPNKAWFPKENEIVKR